jgi:putative ABC transport system permease protein
MLTHYLRLAVKVLLRRPFFSFISLFGTALTLVVLLVVVSLLDHYYAPLPPEKQQDRTLGVYYAIMHGDHGRWSGDAGFKLFDRYARNLPGVERLSIYSTAETVHSYVGGRKVSLSMKRTDADFWKILEFTFLEGRPYATSDVEQAQFVAIVNRATREKIFGDSPTLGRTLEVDDQRFRVIGVVENVSSARHVPFADVWVPYTTAKTDAYRDQMMGGFNAIAMARDPKLLPQIREEFNSRLTRAELPDPKEYKAIIAPFETHFENRARNSPFADWRSPDSQYWKLALPLLVCAFLFMLLPTVNLVNINLSRILERSSEIGVRKAFGASSRTLVGQFVVENVLLTLVGGLIALILAALVLRGINASGVIQYATLGLNFRVFAWGLLIALLFGVMSGVYPAWRMSRLHPVDALRGAVSR